MPWRLALLTAFLLATTNAAQDLANPVPAR
jgi:hypothetical protein